MIEGAVIVCLEGVPVPASPPMRSGTPLGMRPTTDGTHEPRPPVASSPAGQVRHCWVAPTAGSAHPHAGLVLEWRGPAGARQARVTYVVDDVESGEPVHVTQWLRQELLKPA